MFFSVFRAVKPIKNSVCFRHILFYYILFDCENQAWVLQRSCQSFYLFIYFIFYFIFLYINYLFRSLSPVKCLNAFERSLVFISLTVILSNIIILNNCFYLFIYFFKYEFSTALVFSVTWSFRYQSIFNTIILFYFQNNRQHVLV